MPLLIERTLEVGQKLEGFEVKAITDLKQQHMVAYQLEHLKTGAKLLHLYSCLLYTSPSPRDCKTSRMPSSA